MNPESQFSSEFREELMMTFESVALSLALEAKLAFPDDDDERVWSLQETFLWLLSVGISQTIGNYSFTKYSDDRENVNEQLSSFIKQCEDVDVIKAIEIVFNCFEPFLTIQTYWANKYREQVEAERILLGGQKEKDVPTDEEDDLNFVAAIRALKLNQPNGGQKEKDVPTDEEDDLNGEPAFRAWILDQPNDHFTELFEKHNLEYMVKEGKVIKTEIEPKVIGKLKEEDAFSVLKKLEAEEPDLTDKDHQNMKHRSFKINRSKYIEKFRKDFPLAFDMLDRDGKLLIEDFLKIVQSPSEFYHKALSESFKSYCNNPKGMFHAQCAGKKVRIGKTRTEGVGRKECFIL